MTTESDTPTVKAEALATLLNLTARRVQQLAKEGVVVRAGRGRYDLVRSVQGYVRFLQDVADRGQDPQALDHKAERARVAKEQADALELSNRERRGELIPAHYIEEVLAGVAQAAASQLDAVPTRIKQRLPVLSAGDVDVIAEEIAQARNGFAKFSPDAGDASPSGARSRRRKKGS